MLQMVRRARPLFLEDVTAGPRYRKAMEGVGHPPQVNPILRTGGGRNSWKACGCRGGARLGPVLEPPTEGRVGKAELAFRGRGKKGRTLSPRSESDLLSTPFLPRNTFLAKSPREKGDPFPRRAAGGAAAPWHPRTRAGKEESEGSALSGLVPLFSGVSLNGRRGRHFESEERRRRRRRQGGGENGREGTGAATSSGRRARPAAARAQWRRQERRA